MPYALNFYRDQVSAAGASAEALPEAHRCVYVRHGAVTLNGTRLERGQGAYFATPIILNAAGQWSELWRWDLVQPDAPPVLYRGTGVQSRLQMSQVISAIAMDVGTHWLFRLDQIKSAAGRVSNPHRPCPGIRCLLEGEFNIQQAAETVRDIQPGDAWWESGAADVVAWGGEQMDSVIMRGMIVPPELAGKPTGKWQSQAAGNWNLLVESLVSL